MAITKYNYLQYLDRFKVNKSIMDDIANEGDIKKTEEYYLQNLKLYKELVKFFEEHFKSEPKQIDYLKCECPLSEFVELPDNISVLCLINEYKSCLSEVYRKAANKELQKNPKGCIEYAQKAILYDNKNKAAYYTMGRALYNIKSNLSAVEAFEKALEIDPEHISSLAYLAAIYKTDGMSDRDKAIKYYERYIELCKTNQFVYFSLANLCGQFGYHDRTIKYYEAALELDRGEQSVINSLAWYLHQNPDYSQKEIKEKLEFHIENYIKAKNIQKNKYSFKEHSKDKKKKLNIGYISTAFHNSFITLFLKPIFDNYDKSFERVFLYSLTTKKDEGTKVYEKIVDSYLDCTAMTDDEIAEQIYKDKIDILIDLNGFAGSRGTYIMARKPAPIQCIYLDYPNTSGLDTIDYILTDKYTIRPEDVDNYTEKPAYIEAGYNVYDFKNVPVDENPPCIQNGYVTFGVLQKVSKTTVQMFNLWAKILSRVENSKIKFMGYNIYTENKRKEICEIFEKNNVSSNRLIFLMNSDESYVECTKTLDIALDTYPFNGFATSIEQLGLGVPVVTLEGFNTSSRAGGRVLNKLGLDELIAKDFDDYVDVAVNLANDYEKIKYYRNYLLKTTKTSDYTDFKKFTKSLEHTYYKMWCDYCNKK